MRYKDEDEAFEDGIAEGRRLQLAEMRCESCKFMKTYNGEDVNDGDCTSKEADVDWICDVKNFGCIHYRRKE